MEGRSDVDAAADRISKLPEPILQHILSFLLAKDAARMSTLSKVWDSAWNSLSSFNFGDKFLKSKDMPKLVNVVNQTLANRQKHKISMQKFSLGLPHHRWLSYVDDWIKILIACNIKELNLRVSRPIYEGKLEYNSLPEAIFAAKALNVLRLDGFKIELPSDGIKFSSLRELHLSDVFLNEEFIQALCTSCCNLEDLYLQNFDGLASFQVGNTSLPKLKKIDSLHGNLKVVKITACKALKTLYLNCVAVTDEWLESLFSSLPNLEIFKLFSCETLKNMKITSDRLKWLMASRCDNLIAVELDTPNLIKFQYNCHPLSTFKLKASVLLEATFCLFPETDDNHWHSKFTKFLANFNHSKAIELSCHCDRVIVIPKDLRENFLPPLYGTNILQVNLQNQSKYSVVDIIDSMLWISPHLGALSFIIRAPGVKTLKFIYEDASDNDEKPCCASLPWKCWRHVLKKVKLQNFTCMEQQELRNYFFANADISEMVVIPPDCSL
ncbi:F-box/LRR-repeat protein At3g26922-like isoform X2 [Nicotiana tomentosiformis]|uniref:F-box/LRR-repeat protein At3g26922-like isoform X2 n=1 Tax=Nicotiana tomentosiformis TaxID=4098 RepID=UPI00051B5E77|nr:F-box/LRR-repeat protein At3g26922-like isoform X2 [Nicotiana tomentosiformis]